METFVFQKRTPRSTPTAAFTTPTADNSCHLRVAGNGRDATNVARLFTVDTIRG